jgi:hypothetical protein
LTIGKYGDLKIQRKLCNELVSGLQTVSRERVLNALRSADEWHAGQLRGWTKYPYVTHVYHVVSILLEEMEVRDTDTLVAGALHDVVEDCNVRLRDLEVEFGRRVASIVESESENMFRSRRDYMEHFSSAPRSALLVKTADRIDNLRFVAHKGVSAFRRGLRSRKEFWPMDLVVRYVIEAEVYILPYAGKASARGFSILDGLVSMFKEDRSFAKAYDALVASGKSGPLE